MFNDALMGYAVELALVGFISILNSTFASGGQNPLEQLSLVICHWSLVKKVKLLSSINRLKMAAASPFWIPQNFL